MSTDRRRETGVALLIVLWVLVLFSAVAVSYAFSLRSEARMTRNQLERAKAEALAEAGVARALQVLAASVDLTDRYGREERVRLGDGEFRWMVQNAAGLVNLNTADARLLRGVFARFGASEARAEALADAVQDWRDADDLRHLDGAEDRDYLMQGLAYGAADAPFSHKAELQQVLGMDPALYAALAPHLTVHGQHDGINPRFASRGLLLRMGAGTAEEIDDYLQRRLVAPTLAPPPLSAEAVSAGLFGSANSRYAVIRARGLMASGARAEIEAVADLTSLRDGMKVVDWQFAADAGEWRDAD